MTHLTPDREQEIRERRAAIADDPWGSHRDLDGQYTVQADARITFADGFASSGDVARISGDTETDRYRRADFIARAPRDVDALFAEIDRLRGELESRPNRFTAVPAQVDQHLRTILCEDTYLRYQQTIGGHAVEEAAKDLRMEANAGAAEGMSSVLHEAFIKAADNIDPVKGGGPYPSQLLCSQHNGFGPCHGAPWCTPSQDGGAS